MDESLSLEEQVDALRLEKNIYLKAIDAIDKQAAELYLQQVRRDFMKPVQTVNGL